MVRNVLAALVLGCASATPAAAQGDAVEEMLARISGTMSVMSVPTMAEGKLGGCSLQFETLQPDYKYLAGNYVKTSGTVGLLESQGGVAVVVKVVAAELMPADLATRYLDVSRAYLVAPDFRTNFDSLVASQPSDNGGRFSVYGIEPSVMMLIDGVMSNRVSVAFGIGDGSSDIQSDIEIDVVDVSQDGQKSRSPDTATAFLACIKALLESVPTD
ncbi:MAG: hypothetical protein EOP24_16640 [Hyphomicrobiales bacterium]|nr:MAG: hypothetical protein EOP24_16640 [Hyphomicrobiales bacterium]